LGAFPGLSPAQTAQALTALETLGHQANDLLDTAYKITPAAWHPFYLAVGGWPRHFELLSSPDTPLFDPPLFTGIDLPFMDVGFNLFLDPKPSSLPGHVSTTLLLQDLSDS
jgi:hypothetical protein